MFKLFILALAIGAISAATDSEWMVFKATHGKVYHGDMDTVRRYIWEGNLEKIRVHNELYAQGLKSYFLGENQFADMTKAEFVKTMNGYRPSMKTSGSPSMHIATNASLPSTVDWVKKGYVTAVKNQGQCGSCWSFSTTGSMEGAHFKKTGKLVSLSEKNLMDCSKRYGNNGCEGGLMDNAFKYIIANKGIDTEASYPYQPIDGKTCRFNRANVGATEVSYKDVQSGSESSLKDAVATVGPISVAIDANHDSFQLYKGGMYDEPACSSEKLDHGVLAVGYGVHQGKDYWLVKNSWGDIWGMKGYIMMSRNKNNQCGIATSASYPLV